MNLTLPVIFSPAICQMRCTTHSNTFLSSFFFFFTVFKIDFSSHNPTHSLNIFTNIQKYCRLYFQSSTQRKNIIKKNIPFCLLCPERYSVLYSRREDEAPLEITILYRSHLTSTQNKQSQDTLMSCRNYGSSVTTDPEKISLLPKATNQNSAYIS